MSERCPRCDDARCEVPSASAATVGIPGFGEDCSEADNAKWSQLGLAMRDCWTRPAVDWRARALAAEEIVRAVADADEHEAIARIKVHRDPPGKSTYLVSLLDDWRTARSTRETT